MILKVDEPHSGRMGHMKLVRGPAWLRAAELRIVDTDRCLGTSLSKRRCRTRCDGDAPASPPTYAPQRMLNESKYSSDSQGKRRELAQKVYEVDRAVAHQERVRRVGESEIFVARLGRALRPMMWRHAQANLDSPNRRPRLRADGSSRCKCPCCGFGRHLTTPGP